MGDGGVDGGFVSDMDVRWQASVGGEFGGLSKVGLRHVCE